jgi:hypothetical protein
MKFVWPLVLLICLSTGCQPIQRLKLTCDQILATPIAEMRGEVVELDQVLDSLRDSGRVSISVEIPFGRFARENSSFCRTNGD